VTCLIDRISETGLTPLQFAQLFGVSFDTIRHWSDAPADQPPYIADTIYALAHGLKPLPISRLTKPLSVAKGLCVPEQVVRGWRRRNNAPLAVQLAWAGYRHRKPLSKYQVEILRRIDARAFYRTGNGVWRSRDRRSMRPDTPGTLIKFGYVIEVGKRLMLTERGRSVIDG
jgi:hypothetical protein